MKSAPRTMIDLINSVYENKGELNVYAHGHVFRIYHAELSGDGSVLRCRRRLDEATIVIPTDAIAAVEELPTTYP